MNHIPCLFKCVISLFSWKLISGEHFYVDFAVYDVVQGPTLRLFNCDLTGYVGQPPRRSAIVQNYVICSEIINETDKLRCYSTANFFMVNRIKMKDGRSFIFRNRSTGELNTVPDVQVNLGIKYYAGEFPPLESQPQKDDYFTDQTIAEMRNSMSGVFSGVNENDLLAFLKISNFGDFADSRFERSDLLRAFVRTLKNVVDAYKTGAYRPQSFKTPQLQASAFAQKQEQQAANNLRTVMRILIQKLIDPCLIMSQRTTFALGTKTERTEVDVWCGTYCALLSITSGAFSIKPSDDCVSLLAGGRCAHNMCTCDQTLQACGKAFAPLQGTVAMAKCHNELRKFILQ